MGSRNIPLPRDSELSETTFEPGKWAQEWRLGARGSETCLPLTDRS